MTHNEQDVDKPDWAALSEDWKAHQRADHHLSSHHGSRSKVRAAFEFGWHAARKRYARAALLAERETELRAETLREAAAEEFRVSMDCPNHCDDATRHRLNERAARIAEGTS